MPWNEEQGRWEADPEGIEGAIRPPAGGDPGSSTEAERFRPWHERHGTAMVVLFVAALFTAAGLGQSLWHYPHSVVWTAAGLGICGVVVGAHLALVITENEERRHILRRYRGY